jgi:hypothetical protein
VVVFTPKGSGHILGMCKLGVFVSHLISLDSLTCSSSDQAQELSKTKVPLNWVPLKNALEKVSISTCKHGLDCPECLFIWRH